MTLEGGRIQWGGQPNQDRDYPRIVRCRPGNPVKAIVLSDSAELVPVHWLGGRSSPHLVPSSACAGCQAHTRWRLVAYLAVWIYGLRTWAILEIPEEATKEHRDSLTDPRGSLRGLGIVLARTLPYHNAKVSLQWLAANHTADSLPDPPDLHAALARIWSANHGASEGNHGH
jgi:hypothetical protein